MEKLKYGLEHLFYKYESICNSTRHEHYYERYSPVITKHYIMEIKQ